MQSGQSYEAIALQKSGARAHSGRSLAKTHKDVKVPNKSQSQWFADVHREHRSLEGGFVAHNNVMFAVSCVNFGIVAIKSGVLHCATTEVPVVGWHIFVKLAQRGPSMLGMSKQRSTASEKYVHTPLLPVDALYVGLLQMVRMVQPGMLSIDVQKSCTSAWAPGNSKLTQEAS